MISTRISELSKDKLIFPNEAPTHNQALKNAGYNTELTYMKTEHRHHHTARTYDSAKLCLTEKTYISISDKEVTLNK